MYTLLMKEGKRLCDTLGQYEKTPLFLFLAIYLSTSNWQHTNSQHCRSRPSWNTQAVQLHKKQDKLPEKTNETR